MTKFEPVAWRYDTDYGIIYLSMKCDHTYMGADGKYIKGTPLYLAPQPSVTTCEPIAKVVMTYEGENFSDVDRALPFGTPLFTAAQMRQAERDALERAAKACELNAEKLSGISPSNACTALIVTADQIRALIEQSSVASKEGTK